MNVVPVHVRQYVDHVIFFVLDGPWMISAIKNIPAGGELSYYYGEEYFDEFVKLVGSCRETKKCREPTKM